MKTMICLILDRSGSMQGRESDTIGGVNHFLVEQKALSGEASLAMVRFDTVIERFRSMAQLAFVPSLLPGEYVPRGGTSLLDAIGSTLTQLDKDWEVERPDRAVVVIVTDGQENSSKEYTKAKVKAMIESRQKSGLWGFIYLGADVDAFDEATNLGVWSSNAASFTKSARGMSAMYATTSAEVSKMRMTGSTVADLGGTIQDSGQVTKDFTVTTNLPEPTVGAWTAPKTIPETWAPPA